MHTITQSISGWIHLHPYWAGLTAFILIICFIVGLFLLAMSAWEKKDDNEGYLEAQTDGSEGIQAIAQKPPLP